MRQVGIFTGIAFWIALLPGFTSVLLANGSGAKSVQNVGFDQRLNEQIPLDTVFRDEHGKSVQLKEYFGTKPVILMFMYYECPNLCPLALEGLVKSLKPLSFNAGDEFAVLVVSISPAEGPELAMEKKQEHLRRYGRPGAEKGWHFLTGEEGSIKHLTQAAGFRYTYNAAKKQYAHASGVVILTPQGRISRYLYGIEYPPRDVRLGLVEASAGKIGTPVDQLLLLCYQYDPLTGKYTVAITNVLRLAGLITALGLGSYVFIMLRRERLLRARRNKEIQNM